MFQDLDISKVLKSRHIDVKLHLFSVQQYDMSAELINLSDNTFAKPDK